MPETLTFDITFLYEDSVEGIAIPVTFNQSCLGLFCLLRTACSTAFVRNLLREVSVATLAA